MEINMVNMDYKSVDPISDHMMDYLLSQSKESSYFDFKATLDISKNSTDFLKIIKDVYAFANAGGGFLVLGVHENNSSNNKQGFSKVGLPVNFKIDQASLQEKINAHLDTPLEIGYNEFKRNVDGEEKLFALIYIPPSPKILSPRKDGIYKIGKKKINAFSKKTIYTRRGTQSIEASEYEIKQIKNRIKNEAYKISIITGEPDQATEYLFSNLFKVVNLPKFINVGTAMHSSIRDFITTYRQKYPDKQFDIQLQYYNGMVVTLDDLSTLPYKHELVWPNTIHKEPIESWLNVLEKEKIIIALLNKAVLNKGRAQNMQVDRKTKKLYYKTDKPTRTESWRTRAGGTRSRIVVKQIYASQLGRKVFAHAAVRPAIIKLYKKFFLRLNTTMCITDDGIHALADTTTGSIVTRSTYRVYNKQHLNNILFWIRKLGNGGNIEVCRDFVISSVPVQTKTSIGILSDVPVSDLKKYIEEHEKELEGETAYGEQIDF